MSNELEQSVSNDVSVESSPAPESTNSEPAVAETAAPKVEQEKYVPYDRFKELVDQKNEFSKKFEDTEKRLKEFQSRFEKQDEVAKGPSKEEQLIARLKGIDPEFAELIANQVSKTSKFDSLEKRLADYEQKEVIRQQEAVRNQAVSTLEKLKADNKVDNDLHDLFVAKIVQLGNSDPRLGIQDLPRIYKEMNDKMSKYLDGVKRSSLSQYTDAKKTDSKITSSAKAKAPATTQPKPKSVAEARTSMRNEVLEALRASKN